MREILFRGKRLDNGEWVYGYYVYAHTDNSAGICSEENGFVDVNPDTIGQYTGLTDKNGVKIFEGDIVSTPFVRTYRAEFNMKGVVEFHSAAFSILWEDTDFGRNFVAYIDDINVIGNIHDNPELLEMEAKHDC